MIAFPSIKKAEAVGIVNFSPFFPTASINLFYLSLNKFSLSNKKQTTIPKGNQRNLAILELQEFTPRKLSIGFY